MFYLSVSENRSTEHIIIIDCFRTDQYLVLLNIELPSTFFGLLPVHSKNTGPFVGTVTAKVMISFSFYIN